MRKLDVKKIEIFCEIQPPTRRIKNKVNDFLSRDKSIKANWMKKANLS